MNAILEAQQLLNVGTVQYFWKRSKDGYRLVTTDGREMRRTTYCRIPSKRLAMTEMARIFGAEVYTHTVFVNPRIALRHGFQWGTGSAQDCLVALRNAMPVNIERKDKPCKP